MRTLFRFFILLAILAGCASQGFKTPVQQTEAACVSASAAYKVLTVANNAGKLNQAQQAEVLKAIEQTDKFCKPVTPPVDSIQQSLLDRAIDLLEAYALKVKP